MGTSDIHLKLSGIKGESTVVQHKDEIEVQNWGWSVTGATPAPGSGGGASNVARATFSELRFTHGVDRASPELWKACATGRQWTL